MNIESNAAWIQKIKNKHMTLLGTLVINSNFLLKFCWLSSSYKILNFIASKLGIYNMIMIISILVIVKGDPNY